MNPNGETPNFEEALGLAVRAPSVHNLSPGSGESATARSNSSQTGPGNCTHRPAGRDLLMSCGVALQHFTVALSALGWETTVVRFPTRQSRPSGVHPGRRAEIQRIGHRAGGGDSAAAN